MKVLDIRFFKYQYKITCPLCRGSYVGDHPSKLANNPYALQMARWKPDTDSYNAL